MRRVNWAGNLVYGAADIVVPETVAQAQEAVRRADRLRVLGSGHCFNDIADTGETLLSLERMRNVVSLDRAAGRVTVEGGVRYGDLAPWLHGEGYALHNLASLPHISIVGACATATHGSGIANGNLATAVAAIEFIDGGGELAALSRDRDVGAFNGAVVNLGALGVVTRVTLDIEPTYDVAQYLWQDLPLSQVVERFDEIMASAYSVSLFTDWRGDTVNQVWLKQRVDTGAVAHASFHGARRATGKLHPIEAIDAAPCTEQLGVAGPWHERLPHFRMDFTPSSGEELQAEYFLPIGRAAEAVEILSGWGDRLAPVLMISEIRTIAADELWMSPCRRGPCVALHFTCQRDWPAMRPVLAGIEAELAPLGALPHWGKMFAMAPEAVRAGYERLDDFRAFAERHDPDGKFRNAFVERYLFGDG